MSGNFPTYRLGKGIPGGGLCVSRGMESWSPQRGGVNGVVCAKRSKRSGGGGVGVVVHGSPAGKVAWDSTARV